MKYNSYNNRRAGRYRESEKSSIRQRLIEQFLTQLVVCSLLVIIIIAMQFVEIKQLENSRNKIKSAIEHSPSINDITQKAKNVFTVIKENVIVDDKEEETRPVILIDDQVF